jgi:hypothetical protein
MVIGHGFFASFFRAAAQFISISRFGIVPRLMIRYITQHSVTIASGMRSSGVRFHPFKAQTGTGGGCEG